MAPYNATDKMDWFIRNMTSRWFSCEEIVAQAEIEFPDVPKKKLNGTIGQYWYDCVNPKWPAYQAVRKRGLCVEESADGRRRVTGDLNTQVQAPVGQTAVVAKSDTPLRRAQKSQWAAQFLVASELARRGYDVSFTMGNNTPIADLMVGSPVSGQQFWIDVKGLTSKTAWLVTPKTQRKGLFYVLVYLSPLNESGKKVGTDRFFVLTQEETNALLDDYRKAHPGDKGKMLGFGFNDPRQFESAWSKLPG